LYTRLCTTKNVQNGETMAQENTSNWSFFAEADEKEREAERTAMNGTRVEEKIIARKVSDAVAQEQAEKAMAVLGVTLEEIEQADVDKRKDGPRDQRICVCGHAVSKHTVVEGRGQVTCKPSAMHCPCKSLRPVLRTSDTRCFLRKTDGPGAEHALSRGMMEAVKRSKTIEWIVPIVCDRCEQPTDKVIPTPIAQGTAGVYKKNEPAAQNALLCRDCFTAI